MFDSVAVYGLGLLGWSLCSALNKKVPDVKIVALNHTQATCENTLCESVLDEFIDSLEGKGSYVMLHIGAVPVDTPFPIFSRIIEQAGSSLVTDLVSIKGSII